MIPQTDTFSEGEPLRLTASSKIGEYASNIWDLLTFLGGRGGNPVTVPINICGSSNGKKVF